MADETARLTGDASGLLNTLQQAEQALSRFERVAQQFDNESNNTGNDRAIAAYQQMQAILRELGESYEKVARARRDFASTTDAPQPRGNTAGYQNIGGQYGPAIGESNRVAQQKLASLTTGATERFGADLGNQLRRVVADVITGINTGGRAAFENITRDLQNTFAVRREAEGTSQRPQNIAGPSGLGGGAPDTRTGRELASAVRSGRDLSGLLDPGSDAERLHRTAQQLQADVAAATAALREENRAQEQATQAQERATRADLAGTIATREQAAAYAALRGELGQLMSERARLESLPPVRSKVFNADGTQRAGNDISEATGQRPTAVRNARGQIDQQAARDELELFRGQALKDFDRQIAEARTRLDLFDAAVLSAAQAANYFTRDFRRVNDTTGYNTRTGGFEQYQTDPESGVRRPVPVLDPIQVRRLQEQYDRRPAKLDLDDLRSLRSRVSAGDQGVRRIGTGNDVYDEELQRAVNLRTGSVKSAAETTRALEADEERLRRAVQGRIREEDAATRENRARAGGQLLFGQTALAQNSAGEVFNARTGELATEARAAKALQDSRIALAAAQTDAANTMRKEQGGTALYGQSAILQNAQGEIFRRSNGALLDATAADEARAKAAQRLAAAMDGDIRRLSGSAMRGLREDPTMYPGLTPQFAGPYTRITGPSGSGIFQEDRKGGASLLQPGTEAYRQAERALDTAATADQQRARATQLLADVERGAAEQLSRTIVRQGNDFFRFTNNGSRAEQVNGLQARALAATEARKDELRDLRDRARTGTDARFLVGQPTRILDERTGQVRPTTGPDLSPEQQRAALTREQNTITSTSNKVERDHIEAIERVNAALVRNAKATDTAGNYRRVTGADGRERLFTVNADLDRARELQPRTNGAYERAQRAFERQAVAGEDEAKAAQLLADVQRRAATRISSNIVAQDGRYYQFYDRGTKARELGGFEGFAAQQSDTAQRGLGGNFLAGLTSRGFGGGNGRFDLGGLAQAAGTTVKYTALYSALNLVTDAAQNATGALLNYEDSIVNISLAYQDGSAPSDAFVNSLADIASVAGTNVGDVMDQAAVAMRAFGGSLPKDELNEFAESFSRVVAETSTITGQDFDTTANNLRAAVGSITAGQADPTSDDYAQAARQFEDAIAGARQFGGDAADISDGFRAIATTAKAAGFTTNEIANIASLTTARLGESGQLAGTRLNRVFSIISGREGQRAIARLNGTLPDDQKIDTTVNASEQFRQLSAVYQSLDPKKQGEIANALGGTSGYAEVNVLLSQGTRILEGFGDSFDYAGKGGEEFAKIMQNLSGYLRQLQGNAENIITALARSGILGPLKLVAGTLLEATKLVRTFLQGVNSLADAFGTWGNGVKELGATLLGVLLTLKLISAIRNRGGLGQIFGRGEERFAPGRALAREQLRDLREGRNPALRDSTAQYRQPIGPTPPAGARPTAESRLARTRDAQTRANAEAAAARTEQQARQRRYDALRANGADERDPRVIRAQTRLAEATDRLTRATTTQQQATRAATDAQRQVQERARQRFNDAGRGVGQATRDLRTARGLDANDPTRAARISASEQRLTEARARYSAASAAFNQANADVRNDIRQNSPMRRLNNILERRIDVRAPLGNAANALGSGFRAAPGVIAGAPGALATAVRDGLRSAGGSVRDNFRNLAPSAAERAAISGTNRLTNGLERVNQRFQGLLRNPAERGAGIAQGQQRLGVANDRLRTAVAAQSQNDTRDTRRELARARYEQDSARQNLRNLGARNPYSTGPSVAGRVAQATTDAATRAATAASRGLQAGLRGVQAAAVSASGAVGGTFRAGLAGARTAAAAGVGAFTSLAARIRAASAAAASSNFVTGARAGLSNLGQEVKSFATGIGGLFLAIGALTAVINGTKAYLKADELATTALEARPERMDEQGYRDLAAQQQDAAEQAKQNSSGIVGTLVDVIAGGTLSQAAEDLAASAKAAEEAADRARERAQRNAGSTDPTVRLDSVESFNASIEELTSSGRGAATIIGALNRSLDQLGSAASGAMRQLSETEIGDVTGDIPDIVKDALNTQARAVEGEDGFGGILRKLQEAGGKLPMTDGDNWLSRWYNRTLGGSSLLDGIPLIGSYVGLGGRAGDSNNRIDALRNATTSQQEAIDTGVQAAAETVLSKGVNLETASGKQLLTDTLNSNLNQVFTAMGLSPEDIQNTIQTISNNVASKAVDIAKSGAENPTPLKDNNELAAAYASAYAQQAQSAASRAGLNFANTAQPAGTTTTQGEVEAQALVTELASARQRLVQRGASNEALEQFDEQVAQATQNAIQATVSGLQITSALAAATIPSENAVGQLDAQIQGLRDQYNATRENGARMQLRTQMIQLAQQRYLANQQAGQAQDLANQGIYDLVGQAQAKQRAANENLARIQNGYTLDVNGERVQIDPARRSEAEAQARTAAQQAAADVAAAQRARDAATARQSIDPRDTIGNARQDVTDLQREYDELPADAIQQRAQLYRQIAEKTQAVNDALREQAKQIARAAIDPRDTVGNLNQDITDLQNQLRALPNTPNFAGQRAAIQRDIISKEQDRAAAQRAQENARNLSALPVGDTVGEAREAIRAAQAELDGALADSKEYYDALRELNQKKLELAKAEAARAAVSAKLSIDITNSVDSARADYQAALDNLRRIQASGVASQDEINQAELAANQAKAQQQQAEFNEAMYQIDTAKNLDRITHAEAMKRYQTLRAQLAAQLAGMKSTDTAYSQIQKEIDQIDQVLKAAKDEVNQAFNLQNVTLPTLYEVRRAVGAQVDQIRSQVVDYSNTQGTVIINGADMNSVIAYINKTLGTGSTSVYTTSPRRV